MDLHYALNRFSTAETAIMADIPNTTLRTWRARGLLPDDKHWNDSYDSLQVCALAIRKAMVNQGVGPHETSRIGPHYAPSALYAALRHSLQLLEVDGALEIIDNANPDNGVTKSLSDAMLDVDLAALISDLTSGADVVSWRYLISCDQQPYEPAPNLDMLLSTDAISLRYIDLHRLGARTAQLAPGPLLHLKA